MEFYDVVRKRRSIRGYRSTPVPQEKLTRILEAVNLAPTACNLQPFQFMVAQTPALLRRICAVYTQRWLAEAPMIVMALGNRGKAWKRQNGTSAHVIDTAIAMEHLVLAAAEEGLGTCWICAFDQEQMHKVVELQEDWEVIAITPLGFPNVEPAPQTRKTLAEIVRYQ